MSSQNKEYGGKTVLVTGGAQGLGREIAHAFAGNGASVAVIDIQPLGGLQQELMQYEIPGIAIQGDICNPDDCRRFVKAAIEKFGTIDVLINNTGVGGPVKSVMDMNIEEWKKALEVNLTGTMICTRAVLSEMIPLKRGCIINIASNVGKRGLANRSPYVVSNWGKLGLTQTLALELAPFGIRVNAVCPGPIEGPRVEKFFRKMAEEQGKTYEEILDEELSMTAMKRMVHPKEVAEVVMFLASDRSSAMTGQSINVTAGMVMH